MNVTLTGGDIAAIIAAFSSLVAAFGSAAAVIMSARNGRKIEQVHLATNSMKDELVRVTGDAKYLEGMKQGEENGKAQFKAGVSQGEDYPRSNHQKESKE